MRKVEVIAANLSIQDENASNNQKKRVCAYCRVSTDSEDQQSSYSSQIQVYTQKIKSNPQWKFVGIYADEGISGTQIKHRTEFQRMIDDAMHGKIDIIIAKSISRFARNTLDTLKVVRELKEKKVDVHFEKENIQTLNLDSEMFLTLYSAFAQAESESISMNVKMGLRAKMKRGEFIGKCECYGYTWDKQLKTLIPNKEQAPIIKDIYNWYISGYGCNRIAQILNEKGIKSYRGKNWNHSAIIEIIKNEKYIGDLLGQKYYVISPMNHNRVRNYGEKEKYYAYDTHEPIIDRETWNKAQEIYKNILK